MGPKEFFAAIDAGDAGAVRTALDGDPALALARRDDGATPLHAAVFRGHAEIAAILLDAGAAIDARNAEGRTALHDSIEDGHAKLTELLMARGAEVDICTAAILGDLDRLRKWLAADPERVNDRSTELSPLGWASYGNQTATARELIDRGARIDDGELLCAASVGHVEVGELLIDRGADPNGRHGDEGTAPLHAAAAMRYTNDSSRFIRMLLARGADPALETGTHGRTAIQIAGRCRAEQAERKPACRKDYDAVLKILREAG